MFGRNENKIIQLPIKHGAKENPIANNPCLLIPLFNKEQIYPHSIDADNVTNK